MDSNDTPRKKKVHWGGGKNQHGHRDLPFIASVQDIRRVVVRVLPALHIDWMEDLTKEPCQSGFLPGHYIHLHGKWLLRLHNVLTRTIFSLPVQDQIVLLSSADLSIPFTGGKQKQKVGFYNKWNISLKSILKNHEYTFLSKPNLQGT